ncbi:MAG: hypothetical protein HWE15_03280 [Algoriphagus sp.]|uniref:hypothetical protein n=1 Tax=Algoriphagus sp. TaxID=1872435 RepID=UPI0017DEB523|nr:hypothetical protein [Algoriphagus sp.]NVJ85297.1 hypothetical protein [Algoriphagus sp.]
MSKQDIEGVVLEYHSGIIPPPYSHVFRLSLDWSKESLRASLELHYTDREDLTEEEIIEEGFTLSDDYQFNGDLDETWKKPVLELLDQTRYASRVEGEGELTVATTEKGKTSPFKSPSNQEAWQLLAQDLIQAIYETAKKENPLQINFRLVDHDHVQDASIQLQFAHRKVIYEHDGQSDTLNWEYAFQLMKLIFTPDYDYDLAKESPGKKRGIYLDCGDGLWHELGKGVINIDPNFDAIGQIEKHFRNLLES